MSGKKSSTLTPLWSVIQDIKGIGSISRRSFEVKLPTYSRSRSHSAAQDAAGRHQFGESGQQSRWANMPPELLRDVIQRVEASDKMWPSRKSVVACAAVCRNWRKTTKEIVQTLEQCGRLTFPVSLKQPGPRDATVQCYLKRDRTTSTYYLYLGITPSKPSKKNGKFLLAARKFRRASGTDYIISTDTDDFSRGSNTYVGKLRSNFMGTKFTLYDSNPPHDGAVASTNRAGRRILSKQVSPRVPAGSYNIAHIAYELNVLGTRGPRRMECTIHSIPASAMEPGGCAPTPLESATSMDEASMLPPLLLPVGAKSSKVAALDGLEGLEVASKGKPLVLKNKPPRWHDQLQCWCLNFRGRVTVASVKNFQLVAATEIGQPPQPSDPDNVILQFGKIGKDTFTMDYRYPLSAFQAFAISLSSFDTKDSLHCTYALMF
ncbi:hypothetical protein SELMODRAFT_116378 [Selaginella moellendorffii]|uniref:Tubby-like F-box protein n=1 Tax=Selaginella moellendorffii TaxID=88036 RepID=D8SG45_SELML|nr:hypothetical protein SELMODRAFT_116378 [Selaginella moellendorffii]